MSMFRRYPGDARSTAVCGRRPTSICVSSVLSLPQQTPALRQNFQTPARQRHTILPFRQTREPQHQADGLTQHGFLPSPDPLQRLPEAYELWEQALEDLPKRIIAGDGASLRGWLQTLPTFPAAQLLEASTTEDELWRAMLLLSFLAHGYLWKGDGPTPQSLPAALAQPWCLIADRLGVPPVLNYASYILHNWRRLREFSKEGSSTNHWRMTASLSEIGARLDASQPVELGNIVCLNNFLGGMDEEWFRLVHVEIEARASPALASILPGQAAAEQGDSEGVERCLRTIAQAAEGMGGTLLRMSDKCDPHIYYERVRLPTSGWRDNPKLPNGLLYEGVWDAPRQLYGASGAQSSVLPAFDAALGVSHPAGWLRDYLTAIRMHMPQQHRALITQVERGTSLRQFVQQQPGLTELYDECIRRLTAFRQQHGAFARSFIEQRSPKGVGEKGTGGTTFTPALRALKVATADHAIRKCPISHEGVSGAPVAGRAEACTM